MKIFKVTTSVLIAISILLVSDSIVLAQSVEQNQNTEVDTSLNASCSSGNYGQNFNCTTQADSSAKATQSQKVLGVGSRVIYRADGTPVITHEPVNAAVDFNTLTTSVVALLTSSVAITIKLKNS